LSGFNGVIAEVKGVTFFEPQCIVAQSSKQLTCLVFISLCLDFFARVRFISLCFHCLVLYVRACCMIVTWCGERGEIESYLDD